MSAHANRRLLLLTSKTGYQTRAFVDAARELGLDVMFGSDRCHVLDDPWADGAVALEFQDPDDAARRLLNAIGERRVDAVVALGDRPTPAAARVCQALGLPHHPPEAADVCRDKYRSRERLRQAGMNVPAFARVRLGASCDDLLGAAAALGVPCVLKPLALAGSRGVIRADNAAEVVAAFQRIRALLRGPDVRVMREETSDYIQLESYVDGSEVAVEALMQHGRLRVLAIFDKPDPLLGPYFEETIYVTPSRLPQSTQAEIVATLEQAVAALGLQHGPLHAELRVNDQGAWPLEVAARPIGGLCARALRFRVGSEENVSLESAIIRLALGDDLLGLEREKNAAGVMMIPIPEAGIYRGVDGLDGAAATPGIREVRITAKPEQKLVPLPEGSSYLGFIFASAERPEQVEHALRQAHAKLRFHVAAELPVLSHHGQPGT
ncbi:MAG TPA: ATP-grasp domain-containing protein [Terriglobales bacterium]|nr:ATP-grasp domain-containing protein [Terriglobales bacterium]